MIYATNAIIAIGAIIIISGIAIASPTVSRNEIQTHHKKKVNLDILCHPCN